jgi:NADH-quinone oxidoreductase subunit J
MLEWIAFIVLGLALLFSARKVVVSTNLVHSVLWLGATLVSTAGLYVVLHAEFLAAVQVMLYTGGVITLMLFGIMLTRRIAGTHIEHGSGRRIRGAVLALAVFALVALAVRATTGSGTPAPGPGPGDTRDLGALFLTDLMLPFEVLSLLLLAAMIGAIVLARKVDP